MSAVAGADGLPFVLPEGSLITAEIEVRLPCAATPEQVEEWLHFNLTCSGILSGQNPLAGREVTVFGTAGVTCTDTGWIGREEQFDHWSSEDGQRRGYKVRHIRTRRSAPETA